MDGNNSLSSETPTRADIEAHLIRLALHDEAYRKTLLSQPQTVWQQEFGNTAFKDLSLMVLEETNDTLYLVIPWQDEALRQALIENPKAVWQQEFGTTRLSGYMIRVIQEEAGQFCLVLPALERSPVWESTFSQATATSPTNTVASSEQPSEFGKSFHTLTHRPMPKTKLGRIFYRIQIWLLMLVRTNPIVAMLMRPFYRVRSLMHEWRRL